MSETTSITSARHPHLKSAIRLRERRSRKIQDRILIDGLKEIRRACAAGVNIERMFFSRSQLSVERLREVELLISRTDADAFDVASPLYQKLAYGERTGELIAVARTPRSTFADLLPLSTDLIGVIEGIEKPGNIGAVVRTACGAGLGGLIVADPVTDVFNPNVIRASLGSVFSLPVCAAESSATLEWLFTNNFQIVATRVDATTCYTEIDYRKPTAIVMGSEADGLSDQWEDNGIIPICIPMIGDVDSLNISVSAAVLFYEALRQRGTHQ